MPILAFHNSKPGFFNGLNNYSPARLKNLFLLLRARKYEIVDLAGYINAPEKDRLVSLTFDDGYESFYIHAYPILQSLSMPSSVFIPAAFIGQSDRWDYSSIFAPCRHLSRQQIQEISSNGVTIASHGMMHQCLTKLPDRLLNIELKKSKEILEDITGKKIKYISYPFGRFNGRIELAAYECGYANGFSLSFFRQSHSRFTRPRYAVYAFDTPFSVLSKLNCGILSHLEKAKGAVMNAYAGGTIALNKIRGGKFSADW